MRREDGTLLIPNSEELERELKRVRYQERYGRTLRSTIYALIIVAALAVLVATLVMPVLQIYGTSMAPTLEDGNIVVSIKESNLKQKDIIAFYYNNRILVKRVIATPGQWVNMDSQGNVTVDGKLLDEPYLQDKAFGDCNIEFPYQVPEGKYFVMGDHRSVSVDSRNTSIGCVAEEYIVGKLVFCIWPFSNFGNLSQ